MNDPQIRELLRPYLAAKHPGALVIDEYAPMAMQCRPDLAVFTVGGFHAYEIKSGVDTTKRLATQVADYRTLFARVTVVVEKCHLHAALTVSPYVGVLLVEGGELAEYAPAQPVGKPDVLQALWVNELPALCRHHGLKGYSRLGSWGQLALIRERLTYEQCEAFVIEALRKRYTRSARLSPVT